MANARKATTNAASGRARSRKLGIPASELDDTDLERELRTLWRTRQDVVVSGTAAALRAHTDRMMELEHEYIARFPGKTRPARGRSGTGKRGQRGQRRSA